MQTRLPCWNYSIIVVEDVLMPAVPGRAADRRPGLGGDEATEEAREGEGG